MIKDIQIGDRVIGEKHPPFIIAEMSGNHNQSLERALEIVDAAADSGAHAIKLQTYTADTMTIKASHGLFQIDDTDSLWEGNNLYDLYKIAYTPWDWHEKIFERAKSKGLITFSTPFDVSAVDFLEELGVSVYKIASFENTDWPLLKRIAKTGKPVIMSTGLTNLSDIDESVRLLREHGCDQLIILKCTSTYPASPENTNILSIPHMRDMFDCHIGLSDHTMGIGAAIASIALGARVVEKHFTLRRADGGVDSEFSIEPEELKSLVIESDRAYKALGKVKYGIQESEKNSLRFKRSIYVVTDVKAGDVLNENNVRVTRPGDGLHSKYYDIVLGKKALRDINAGEPLSFDMLG